jgi:hypothetical protein
MQSISVFCSFKGLSFVELKIWSTGVDVIKEYQSQIPQRGQALSFLFCHLFKNLIFPKKSQVLFFKENTVGNTEIDFSIWK